MNPLKDGIVVVLCIGLMISVLDGHCARERLMDSTKNFEIESGKPFKNGLMDQFHVCKPVEVK